MKSFDILLSIPTERCVYKFVVGKDLLILRSNNNWYVSLRFFPFALFFLTLWFNFSLRTKRYKSMLETLLLKMSTSTINWVQKLEQNLALKYVLKTE